MQREQRRQYAKAKEKKKSMHLVNMREVESIQEFFTLFLQLFRKYEIKTKRNAQKYFNKDIKIIENHWTSLSIIFELIL